MSFQRARRLEQGRYGGRSESTPFEYNPNRSATGTQGPPAPIATGGKTGNGSGGAFSRDRSSGYLDPTASPTTRTGLSSAQLLAASGGGLTVFVLAFYIFLIYSRAPEVIAIHVGNLRIALILCAILVITTLVNQRLLKLLTHRITLCFFIFTFCLIFSVPTSVWRSESLRLIFLQWPLPLASFICIAVLITSFRDCARVVSGVVWGVLCIVLLSFTSSGDSLGRLGVNTSNASTLSNPNLLALQLLMGLPFCVWVIMRRGMFSLVGSACTLLTGAATYIILATGSRSGLLALACGALFLFLRGSAITKLKLAGAGMVAVLFVFLVLPASVTERYFTIFTDSAPSNTNEVTAAVNSSRARRHHLEQSISLTLQNPLVGVGAGQFKVAAASMSEANQQRADWLETHNTFTQVSSEAGIPAFLVFTLAIIFAGLELFSVYRATSRRPDLADVSSLTLMVLLSLVMTVVNANFASIAYQSYFPFLCGMAVAVTYVARTLLNAPAPEPVQQSWNRRY